jgi:hypothetical protein
MCGGTKHSIADLSVLGNEEAYPLLFVSAALSRPLPPAVALIAGSGSWRVTDRGGSWKVTQINTEAGGTCHLSSPTCSYP